MDDTGKLPFILNGRFFKVVRYHTVDGKTTVKAKCMNCHATISGNIRSSSNFITHLKRMHRVLVPHYEADKLQANGTTRSPRHHVPIHNMLSVVPKLEVVECPHNSPVWANEILKSDVQQTLNRLVTTTRGHVPPQNMLSETDRCQVNSPVWLNQIFQSDVQQSANRLVTRYLIDGLLPVSIVQRSEFSDLVTGLSGLQSPVQAPSVHVVGGAIKSLYDEVMSDLRHSLPTKDCVCTTADLWTYDGRRFLTVAAHWISHTLQRESAAIACRFVSQHSSSHITKLLSDIHAEFGLNCANVVCMVTDSHQANDHASQQTDVNSSNTVQFVDLESILHQQTPYENAYYLPPYRKCSSSLLGLVAVSNSWHDVHADMCRSALDKCVNACEVSIGTSPTYSHYECVRVAFRDELPLGELSEQEQRFLEEVLMCTSPIYDALDLLLTETDCFSGELLPILLRARDQLRDLEHQPLQYCSLLLTTLLTNLHCQFHEYIDFSNADDLIIASISHPYFKLRWLPPLQADQAKDIFVNAAKALHIQKSDQRKQVRRVSSEARAEENRRDSFFGYSSPNSYYDVAWIAQLECMDYFQDSDTSIASLNKYPTLQNIFKKYNTPLPSSAPVKRLFDYNAITRMCTLKYMTDEEFQQRVLLKANSKMIERMPSSLSNCQSRHQHNP